MIALSSRSIFRKSDTRDSGPHDLATPLLHTEHDSSFGPPSLTGLLRSPDGFVAQRRSADCSPEDDVPSGALRGHGVRLWA